MKSRIDSKTLEDFLILCKKETQPEKQSSMIDSFIKQYQITLIQPKKPVSLLQLLEGYLFFVKAKEFILKDYKICLSEWSIAYNLRRTEDENTEADRVSTYNSAEQARLATLSKLKDILASGEERQCIYSTSLLLVGMGLHESADLLPDALIRRLEWFNKRFIAAERIFDKDIYLVGAMVYMPLASYLLKQYKLGLEYSTTPAPNHILSNYFFAKKQFGNE